MKITKTQLRQIIKEELANTLSEADTIEPYVGPQPKNKRNYAKLLKRIAPLKGLGDQIRKKLGFNQEEYENCADPRYKTRFVEGDQWESTKAKVGLAVRRLPTAAKQSVMYDEIMGRLAQDKLDRCEIYDFTSAFDELYVELEGLARDGDL